MASEQHEMLLTAAKASAAFVLLHNQAKQNPDWNHGFQKDYTAAFENMAEALVNIETTTALSVLP